MQLPVDDTGLPTTGAQQVGARWLQLGGHGGHRADARVDSAPPDGRGRVSLVADAHLKLTQYFELHSPSCMRFVALFNYFCCRSLTSNLSYIRTCTISTLGSFIDCHFQDSRWRFLWSCKMSLVILNYVVSITYKYTDTRTVYHFGYQCINTLLYMFTVRHTGSQILYTRLFFSKSNLELFNMFEIFKHLSRNKLGLFK